MGAGSNPGTTGVVQLFYGIDGGTNTRAQSPRPGAQPGPTVENLVSTVLDKNAYTVWRNLEKDLVKQRGRTKVNLVRFDAFKGSQTIKKLQAEMLFFEKAASDCRTAMGRMTRGQTVDVAKTNKLLYDILPLVENVVSTTNDGLDILHGGGLALAAARFGLSLIPQHAAKCQKALDALKNHLDKAKSEVVQAYAQTAINTAVTVIMIVKPEIGIVVKLCVSGGQIVLDQLLGPSTSSKASAGSTGSYVSSPMADAFAKVEGAGSKTKTISRGAGGALSVVGFGFDVNEILVGYRNLEQARAAMALARREYANLVSFARTKVAQYSKAHTAWQKGVKNTGDTITKGRKQLHAVLQGSGYRIP